MNEVRDMNEVRYRTAAPAAARTTDLPHVPYTRTMNDPIGPHLPTSPTSQPLPLGLPRLLVLPCPLFLPARPLET